MYKGEQLTEFRKHWSQTANDAQELGRFLTRVDDAVREIWEKYLGPSEATRERFALISGTQKLAWNQQHYPYTQIYATFRLRPITLYQIIEQMQFVLWTLQAGDPEYLPYVSGALKSVIDASPGIPVRLVSQKGTAILLPTGARLLDEAVIDDNLAWLERYPDSAKAFQEALRLHSRKDPNNFGNLLDNLRMSIEQILKAVLKNRKTLENQKEEFLRWLKAHDAHSQIGNIYHDLLFGKFAQYQNDAVKHNEDQYTAAEIEFMLYLTGTLLRFIQRASETTPKTKSEIES